MLRKRRQKRKRNSSFWEMLGNAMASDILREEKPNRNQEGKPPSNWLYVTFHLIFSQIVEMLAIKPTIIPIQTTP